MSQLTNIQVEIETQKALENINDMTEKIREKLKSINQLIKSKGLLEKLSIEANNKLANQAQQLGKIGGTLDAFEDADQDENQNFKSSIDAVTQKFMEIMEDS